MKKISLFGLCVLTLALANCSKDSSHESSSSAPSSQPALQPAPATPPGPVKDEPGTNSGSEPGTSGPSTGAASGGTTTVTQGQCGIGPVGVYNGYIKLVDTSTRSIT